jgi:hypothetical protein
MTLKKNQSPLHDPSNTADPVPPGATGQAFDRDRPSNLGGPQNSDAPERVDTQERLRNEAIEQGDRSLDVGGDPSHKRPARER